MADPVSPQLVGQWLKGWSLSRNLPLPVGYQSGFKVDVGYEKQKKRFVFPQLNNDFFHLANQIDEAWVFLKVCATPEEIAPQLPKKWTILPQGYMMYCFEPMAVYAVALPEGYRFEFNKYHLTHVAKIIAPNGELASIGRVVIIDDLAVYDRISTEAKHQRKGLATLLMAELQKIALSKGISRNFLVATEAGKLLYQSLGWKLYSPYTSVVITD